MAFTVNALRGGSSSRGVIDHRLERRALINQFRVGRLRRDQVCDAHPELIRAATNVGTPTDDDVPDLRRTAAAPRHLRLRSSPATARTVRLDGQGDGGAQPAPRRSVGVHRRGVHRLPLAPPAAGCCPSAAAEWRARTSIDRRRTGPRRSLACPRLPCCRASRRRHAQPIGSETYGPALGGGRPLPAADLLIVAVRDDAIGDVADRLADVRTGCRRGARLRCHLGATPSARLRANARSAPSIHCRPCRIPSPGRRHSPARG